MAKKRRLLQNSPPILVTLSLAISSSMFKTLLLTLCFFLSQGVYCLAQNDSLEQVIESLEAYHHRFLKEKVYLHFDKPYYIISDDKCFIANISISYTMLHCGMS